MKIRRIYNLDFKGFTREGKKNTLPDYSGLYFVYRGVRHKGKDNTYTCSLKELLYIGQAENINERINGEHDHYEDWCSYLDEGEMLYYSTCPVPQYQLDEVEAALDIANVERFAKYLKEFSNTTQFIVVTHREGTMEECDLLYGATMQQKGVTKLVSVKLEEAIEISDPS